MPFPFTDQSAIKRRPAVVVSSHTYNQSRPDIILMAITSQLSNYVRVGEVLVTDWRRAGLLKSSTIKPILTTIEKSLVVRTLGKLEQADRIALGTALKTILG